ncbi:MAG: transcription antitermination factor NusB [Gemmataceae bacterium]|nr:class I SAM-dependent methyltransferase [Gemmata sp.]MDW8197287.1 transcription antitermination factor NusB [Gemmataceae bacterium]
MTTARQVTLDVLNRSRARAGFAAELVDEALTQGQLAPQDRRFVTQLVCGVIRRRGTLDALVKPFIQRPPHTVEARVWDILRLGAFQLAFLTHIPPHAAVHESVELATPAGVPQAKGFINGVLRRVAELVTNDFCETAAANTVPMDVTQDVLAPLRDSRSRADTTRPPGRYRVLTQPVLPDPTSDFASYYATAFSFPRWLTARWLARYGADECTRLGFWFNSPPPLWIRVNKLRSRRENYRLQLTASGIDAEPGQHPQSLRLRDHIPIRDLPGFDSGEWTVQDHSSMLVASAVGVQPGQHVLDLCAAPGSKTTHLAELMDNRGHITACDIDDKRLKQVTALCQRLGVGSVETVLLTESGGIPPGPFDAALVDVPCSNTGVMNRRPEVRWRLKPREFEHLIRLQTRLLIEAVTRVRPGGAVVYSTCSIEPEENEGVVKVVRQALRGVMLEADHVAVPGQPSDGGYWARLRVAK